MKVMKGLKRMMGNTSRIDRPVSEADSLSAPASSPSPEVSPSGQTFTGRASQDKGLALEAERPSSKARHQLSFEPSSPPMTRKTKKELEAEERVNEFMQKSRRDKIQHSSQKSKGVKKAGVRSRGSSPETARARKSPPRSKPALSMYAENGSAGNHASREHSIAAANPVTGGEQYFRKEAKAGWNSSTRTAKTSHVSVGRIGSADIVMDSWQTSSHSSARSSKSRGSSPTRKSKAQADKRPSQSSASPKQLPVAVPPLADQHKSLGEAERQLGHHHQPIISSPHRTLFNGEKPVVNYSELHMDMIRSAGAPVSPSRGFVGELPLSTQHRSRRASKAGAPVSQPSATAVVRAVRSGHQHPQDAQHHGQRAGRLASGQNAQEPLDSDRLGHITLPVAPVAAQAPQPVIGRTSSRATGQKDYARHPKHEDSRTRKLKSEPWELDLLRAYDSPTLTSFRGDNSAPVQIGNQENSAGLESDHAHGQRLTQQRAFTRDASSVPRYSVQRQAAPRRASSVAPGWEGPQQYHRESRHERHIPGLDFSRASGRGRAKESSKLGPEPAHHHRSSRAPVVCKLPLDHSLATTRQVESLIANEHKGAESSGSRKTRTSCGWQKVSPPDSLSSEEIELQKEGPLAAGIRRMSSSSSFGSSEEAVQMVGPLGDAVDQMGISALQSGHTQDVTREMMRLEAEDRLDTEKWQQNISRQLQYGDVFGPREGKDDSAYRRLGHNIGTLDLNVHPAAPAAATATGSKGLRRYLEEKLSAMEEEMVEVRKEHLLVVEERDNALRKQEIQSVELTQVKAKLASMQDLLAELNADLRASHGDKRWSSKEANQALQEAQQEALAQEEAAELARGELDELKRRMRDEVEHARTQALQGLPNHQQEVAKLRAELDRAHAGTERVRQERNELAEIVETRKATDTRLSNSVRSLKEELTAKDEELARLRETMDSVSAAKETEAAALVEERDQMAANHQAELASARAAGQARLEEETGELYEEMALLQAQVDALNQRLNDNNTVTPEAQVGDDDPEMLLPDTEAGLLDETKSEEDLKAELKHARAEVERLQAIEALASEAVEALERQTEETMRLRALSERLMQQLPPEAAAQGVHAAG